MQKIDVLGFKYDDAEPAFTAIAAGTHYYHLKTKRLYERNSFDAQMVRNGTSFNEGELGIPSNELLVIREDMLNNLYSPAPPAAPSTLTVVGNVAGALDLTWFDNSNNEAGFRVERSMDDTSYAEVGSTPQGVTMFTDTGLADSTVYYYRVYAFNIGGDSAPATGAGTTITP